ncbi:unnamed protein product, partial [Staurois parvus]
DFAFQGGLLYLLTALLPVSSDTLLWIAVHSTTIQSSVITVKPTHTAPPVKHSQHTVNPLITPHVSPFLPMCH